MHYFQIAPWIRIFVVLTSENYLKYVQVKKTLFWTRGRGGSYGGSGSRGGLSRQENESFKSRQKDNLSDPNLHPSWAAKRKQTGISEFAGKKIKFDDDGGGGGGAGSDSPSGMLTKSFMWLVSLSLFTKQRR